MKLNPGKGFKAKKEVLDKILEKLQKNNKCKSDFIVKALEDFKSSVFLLCKRNIEEELVPKKFEETTLQQIWKN